MQLANKVAVIYGGGGAIGGAIAQELARRGATVHLAGRTREKLEVEARRIREAGGTAHVARVDVLDSAAVEAHADATVARSGRIDIAVNAVGFVHVQGTPLAELSLEDYEHTIHAYARAHFLTAKAAARHMVARRSGVILLLSTPASRRAFPGVLGFGSACGQIEAFARHLACELGPDGIRVICLRPDAIPEAVAAGSHSREVFEPVAAKNGLTVDAMLAQGAGASMLRRAATLADIGAVAAFAASPAAAAMTATTLNLSCGSLED
jgi:3-oxoacyl-[acyl-carrier protein] reductase